MVTQHFNITLGFILRFSNIVLGFFEIDKPSSRIYTYPKQFSEEIDSLQNSNIIFVNQKYDIVIKFMTLFLK